MDRDRDVDGWLEIYIDLFFLSFNFFLFRFLSNLWYNSLVFFSLTCDTIFFPATCVPRLWPFLPISQLRKTLYVRPYLRLFSRRHCERVEIPATWTQIAFSGKFRRLWISRKIHEPNIYDTSKPISFAITAVLHDRGRAGSFFLGSGVQDGRKWCSLFSFSQTYCIMDCRFYFWNFAVSVLSVIFCSVNVLWIKIYVAK